MKILNLAIVILALAHLLSCKSEPINSSSTSAADVFEPQLVSINVPRLESGIGWYVNRLGFSLEKDIVEYPSYNLRNAFIEKDGFRIELLEQGNSVFPIDIMDEPSPPIGGFSKVGMSMVNVGAEYNRLNAFGDVNLITEVGNVPTNPVPFKWPTQYFLTADPFGNYVQFFNSGTEGKVRPWLFMITVKNLDESIHWYTGKLGLTHHFTVGEAGNRRAIMQRNNYVLELIEQPSAVTANELNSMSETFGIKKLAFRVKDIDYTSQDLQKKEVDIVSPLQNSKLPWAQRTMIIRDLEGNMIQLLEI